MHSILLCATLLLQAASTQTDWTGGKNVIGPVVDFGTTFYASDSVTYNVSGQISPVASVTNPAGWIKHIVERNNPRIDGHGGLYPADFDGDGDLDLAGWISLACTMRFYRNYKVEYDSVGYRAVASYAAPPGSKGKYGQTWVGDINGDGRPDVAVACSTRVFWYENRGNFSFVLHDLGASVHTSGGVEGADINRDGLVDLVVGDRPLEVWYQQPGGTFRHQSVWSGESYKLLVGNINGDTWPDLLAEDQVFLNNNGTFPSTPTWNAGLSGPDGIWIRDFNNDGLSDLLICDQWSSTPGIYWYENLGNGTSYRQHRIYKKADAKSYGDGACAEDIDADGKADVVGSYSKVGYFRQVTLDSFVLVQLDTITDSHWIRTANLDYKPNGTDIDIDILASGRGQFVWYENPQQLKFSTHAWLVSSILDAGCRATWQTLVWDAVRPSGAQLDLYVRTGPTPAQCTTNVWYGPISVRTGTQFDSTSLGSCTGDGDRYFQYRVVMAGNNIPTPALNPVVYSLKVVFDRIDVGVTGIVAPVGMIDSGIPVAPRASVHNFGTSRQTFGIEFRVDDGYSSVITRTVEPGADSIFSFGTWQPLTCGTHAVQCSTLLDDHDNSNNRAQSQVLVAYHDVGASQILAPVDSIDSGSVIVPRVMVHNYGSRTEVLPVTLRIGSVYDQTVTGVTLASGQTDTVDFPGWIAQPLGRHATLAFTYLANDRNRPNDTVKSAVTVIRPPRHNVGATAILTPVGTLDSGTVVTPQAVVYNFGTRNETFPITFRIDTAYDKTVSGLTLTPGQTDTVDFPAWIVQPLGGHGTMAFTNLVGDEHRENDTVKSTVTVIRPPRHNVGATAILAPVGTLDSGTVVTPKAVIYNFGTRAETFPVTFRIGTVYDQTASGLTLTPGQTDTVDFPAWVVQPLGTHGTVAFTNLTGDEHRENDTVRSTVTVIRPPRHDVGATMILAPAGTLDSGTVVTPRAVVYNFQTRTETFPVTFRIGSVYDKTVTGVTLTPGQTDTVDFPAWVLQPLGTHGTVAFTNLTGDEHRENDTVRSTVTVIRPPRHNVGATAILNPVGTLDSGTVVTPKAVIYNFGTRTEIFPVTFTIGSVYANTVTGVTLTAGQTDTVDFASWVVQPLGTHATVAFTNLTGDEHRENDTVKSTVTVIRPPRHNVGATAILTPVGTLDSGTVVTPRAVIYNFGTRDETFPVTFRIGTVYDQTASGLTLSPGQTDTVDFPAWVVQPLGTHGTMAVTNLTGDEHRENDTVRSTVTVIRPPRHDVGATTILAPVGTLDSGTVVTPRAVVYNFQTRTETFPVTFRIGSVYDKTVTGITLTPGQTDTVDFANWVVQPLGTHATIAFTGLTGDEHRENDTVRSTVTVIRPPRHNVGATAILVPVGTIDSGTVVVPQAVVFNFGTRTETFPVTFRVGNVYDQTVTGLTLAAGQTDTVDFPFWVVQPLGSHQTIAFTALSGDEHTENDTVTDGITVIRPPRHNVGATTILAPVGTLDSGTVVTPRAVVYNFGTRTETFPVTFTVGSDYTNTVTSVTLTAGQTDTVDFASWIVQPLGTHPTMAFTVLAGDEHPENDTVTDQITVIRPPRHDVGATMILAPVGTLDSGTVVTPRAVVYNFQTRTETFPVTFRIGSVYDQTEAGITLTPGQTDTVDFPAWVVEPLGTHGTAAFTNLTGDEHPENDTVTDEITVIRPPRHDVGATAILVPVGTLDSGTVVTPKAIIYNFGTRTETFPVTFTIGYVYTNTVTGVTLAAGQTDTVDFASWIVQPLGSHGTMAFTYLAGDEHHENDTVTGEIAVIRPPRHDVGSTVILAPGGALDSGTVVVPMAVVCNYGTRNETFPVTFRIGGLYDETMTGITLTPGQTDTLDFPTWVAQPVGTYLTTAFTMLTGDEHPENDTATNELEVLYPVRHDVGATVILAPVGTLDSGTVVVPQAAVYNFGTRTETFPVTFRIGTAFGRQNRKHPYRDVSGDFVYDQTVTGITLTPGQTDTVDFPNWVAEPLGVTPAVALTDLSGDENRANDTVRNTVTIQLPPRHDVGATMILAPVGTLDSGTVVVPRAVIYNYGTRNETFPVTFTIDDVTAVGLGSRLTMRSVDKVYCESLQQVLEPGQTDTVDFPNWTAQPLGSHATQAFTNLSGDQNRSNDMVRSTVTVQLPPRHDVGATAILAPVGKLDSGTVVTPRAVINNFGTRSEAFQVIFKVDASYAEVVQASLIPGQTDTVDFPDWVSQPIGTHPTICYTTLANDQDRSNDSTYGSVEVVLPERHDVGTTLILAPAGQVDSGTVVTPCAVVHNFGTRGEAFQVIFKVDASYAEVVQGSLTPGQTDTLGFRDWVAKPVGTHPTICYTTLADDQDRSNDTAYGSVEVVLPERHDVGTTAILAPVGTLDSGTIVTPIAVIRNFGTRTEEVPVTFTIAGGYTQSLTRSLSSGQTDTVSFPEWSARPTGTPATTCFTSLARDANRHNDTTASSVAVLMVSDVGTEAVLAPVGMVKLAEGILTTRVTPKARIANSGHRTEGNFQVRFRIDSIVVHAGADTVVLGAAYAETLTVATNLKPGESIELSFPDALLGLGDYAVSCSTMLAGDGNPANDKMTQSFKVTYEFSSVQGGELAAVIYTRAGERVRRIARNILFGDPLLVQWDGLNDRGQRVAPGTYLCLLRFDPTTGTTKQQVTNMLVTSDFTSMVLSWRQP